MCLCVVTTFSGSKKLYAVRVGRYQDRARAAAAAARMGERGPGFEHDWRVNALGPAGFPGIRTGLWCETIVSDRMIGILVFGCWPRPAPKREEMRAPHPTGDRHWRTFQSLLLCWLIRRSVRSLRAGVVAAGLAVMLAVGASRRQTAVVPDFSPEPTKLGSNPSQKVLEIEAERLWNKRRYDALQELRRLRSALPQHQG